MKLRLKTNRTLIFIILILLLLLSGIPIYTAVAEETESADAVSDSLTEILDGLDLSELQEYLDENSESILLNFGNTAEEIINYLINGNTDADYGSYISEIMSVVLTDAIDLIPLFAEALAVALLCVIFSGAQGGIIGKSTLKVVRLACYSVIIVLLSSALVSVVAECIECVSSLQKQMEIISPILITLTVLTGGTSSAAIYQPAAVFLSEGAVEIISGFIFPAAIVSTVLNFTSKINPQISFTGISKLIKSIMKWVLGFTVAIFSLFLTVQSAASSIFDGVMFKTMQYVVSNSVPIVGGFISSGFDLLTAAGLMIKNSVGICGILLIVAEIVSPLILLIAFSLMLKVTGAVIQAAGDNEMYGLMSDLSSDADYFIAGLLVVAFMYALMIMLIINSATSFL